jgi:exopolysaccharide biosynthesis polyprenyl glycosylphosphotransferase
LSAPVDDVTASAALGSALPARAAGASARPALHRRRALVAHWLTLADAFAAVAVLLVVAIPAADRAGDGRAASTVAALIFLAAAVGGARLLGLHHTDLRIEHSTVDDIPRLIALVTGASWVYVVALSLLSLAPLEAATMLELWSVALAFFFISRAVVRAGYRRHADFAQAALVVGAGDVGQLVARKLQHHPEYGLRLHGLVDDHPRDRRADLDDLTVLGGMENLPALVEQHGIDRVMVAFSETPDPDVLETLRALTAAGVRVDIVPRLFEAVSLGAALDAVEGLPFVSLRQGARSQPYAVAKRAVDVIGALAGLLLTLPLLLYIAWRIRSDSPGPILFRQQRLGMDMQEFTSLKFRTMRVGTSSDEHRDYIRATATAQPTPTEGGLFKLERRNAVTSFGRWLRKTSLDELPQLINVLRGEMSLVGPRPCIPYETEFFEPRHFERFTVPQGITGLWQVTARAHASFAEALDIDVAYTRSCTFWLDLKLILLTPLQMLGLGSTR